MRTAIPACSTAFHLARLADTTGGLPSSTRRFESRRIVSHERPSGGRPVVTRTRRGSQMRYGVWQGQGLSVIQRSGCNQIPKKRSHKVPPRPRPRQCRCLMSRGHSEEARLTSEIAQATRCRGWSVAGGALRFQQYMTAIPVPRFMLMRHSPATAIGTIQQIRSNSKPAANLTRQFLGSRAADLRPQWCSLRSGRKVHLLTGYGNVSSCR